MLKTNRNTTAAVSILSVMIITALTASGIGGEGRETMTAYASGSSRHIEETKEEEQEFLDSVRDNPLTDQVLLQEETKETVEETVSIEKPEGKGPGVSLKTQEKISESPQESVSEEDYEVLLKIVEAEAGVCDAKGKILVANVVLNRVHSEEFPNTVKEVVYQPSQFSPVSNGSINTCQVTQQTVECVRRALEGEDYSQGALYFMNRGAARTGAVSWFDNRLDFLFSHQGHEFFK